VERLLEPSFDSGPLENAVFVVRHTVAVGYRRPVDGRLSHAAKIDSGAGRSRILAANRRFDYEENAWSHSIAAALGSALADDLFRFDASEVMPPTVGSFPYYEGMVTYVSEGAESLDRGLSDLEAAWDDVS
jgi:hypothetical protein